MNEIICKSFTEIIFKYISHRQLSNSNIEHALISHDLPKQLTIGFSCCDEHYLISISDIRKRRCMLQDAAINKKFDGFFDKNIMSGTRRIHVANIITRYVKSSIKDLDKYLDLKAFW
jgi:hypothetical protein